MKCAAGNHLAVDATGLCRNCGRRIEAPAASAPCLGSYGAAVAHTTRHGRRVVTGECPTCGKRVAYVTAYGLPTRPRVLGRHAAKPAAATAKP